MELHLTARQTGLWQRLMALAREQLMGLAMQMESTGKVDRPTLTTLAQQLALDDPLPDDRLSQRVLSTLALACPLSTSPGPRDRTSSRMPSSA